MTWQVAHRGVTGPEQVLRLFLKEPDQIQSISGLTGRPYFKRQMELNVAALELQGELPLVNSVRFTIHMDRNTKYDFLRVCMETRAKWDGVELLPDCDPSS